MKLFYDVRNKNRKLVAKLYPDTGLVISVHKKQIQTVELAVGKKTIIERDGVETQITRISETEYIIV